MIWVTFVALCAGIVLWWASNLAGRLHRIHIRRDNLLISLRWQLIVRESLISRLLEEGFFDVDDRQTLSNYVEAANLDSDADLDEYLTKESQVSGALREVFEKGIKIKTTAMYSLLQELAQCCYRIELARRFHNDAVGAAHLLHERLLVRVFRLAGNTPQPKSLDMDDIPPKELQEILSGH
ncbi:MAG: hypothetical protein ACO3XJ_02930 [Candidatus Nanopelagicales bacterium]